MKIIETTGRFCIRGLFFAAFFFAAFFTLASSFSYAIQDEGDADLEEAFERKIQASSTRDLEAVVRLCKSAIEKGLDEEGQLQAAQLIAATSMEHAEQLLKRIFRPDGGRDPRWQKFRTEAIVQLNQAIEFQPTMTQAYLMIAELNIRLPQGDIDAAREAIDKAIEEGGEDRTLLSKALFFRASMSDNDEEKLADINQAIKIDPENRDALKIRAVFLIDQNQIAKGLEDIESWLSAPASTVDEYLEVIQLFVAMIEKWNQDARVLEAESDPDEDTEVEQEINENLQTIKTETLSIIGQGLDKFPEEFRFHAIRSGLYSLDQQWDDALVEINKALELQQKQTTDPADFRLLLSRVNVLKNLNKIDEAIADFDELTKQAKQQRNAGLEDLAFQGKLDLLILSERFEEAIQDLEDRVSASGPNPGISRMMAILHNANKNPRKAIEIYDQLIEEVGEPVTSDELELRSVDERLHPLFLGRADARLSLGEHQLAIEDYSKALEMYDRVRDFLSKEGQVDLPEDKHLLNNLAWVLSTSPFDELRDGQKAIELATRAAEASEFSEAYILSTLASAYAESGDFDSAIKWIKEAIEVNKKDREQEETKRNLEQKDSLQNEYDHYLRNEPFRERQDVEEEKAKEADHQSEND